MGTSLFHRQGDFQHLAAAFHGTGTGDDQNFFSANMNSIQRKNGILLG